MKDIGSILLKRIGLFNFLIVLVSCCSQGCAQNISPNESDLLNKLDSPILIKGNDSIAYRDPLILFEENKFWLFFSIAVNQTDGIKQGDAFWQTAYSTSIDLKNWTDPIPVTPADRSLNFCSPGSIVKHDDEWIMALQTYPTPHGEKFGNDHSRLWLMKSHNLREWGEPELIHFLGPDVSNDSMPRMIDPYLMRDKDNPDRWWCFCKIKQTGVSMSWSDDLKTWHYQGRVDGGENACVIIQDDQYVLYHSPENGIGEKRSSDLYHWRDSGLFVFDQKNWPWAQGRLTAGYVMDGRNIPGIGKYVMVFHGERDKDSFTVQSSIGLVWSDDLVNWDWPGKTKGEN